MSSQRPARLATGRPSAGSSSRSCHGWAAVSWSAPPRCTKRRQLELNSGANLWRRKVAGEAFPRNGSGRPTFARMGDAVRTAWRLMKGSSSSRAVRIVHVTRTKNMQTINSVVAVYNTHPQAEEAVRAFQSSGFDMKKLSIVGKDYHTEEHVVGFYNADDRMKFWGKRGAFCARYPRTT